MTTTDTPAFRCEPLACTLAVKRCVQRRAVSRSTKRGINPLLAGACVTCEVGAAHKRGELPERWPDGSPVVRLALPVPHALPESKPAPRTVIPDRGGETLARRPKMTDEERRERNRLKCARWRSANPAPKKPPSGRRAGNQPALFTLADGRTLTLDQMAAESGLHRDTIYKRIRNGRVTPDVAMKAPVHHGRRTAVAPEASA